MVLAEIGTAGVISAYFFRHMTSGYSLNVSDPIKGQPVQLSDYLFVSGCGLVFWLLVMLRAKLHDSGDRQADIRRVAKLVKLIAPITTLNLCGCLLASFMKLPLLVRFLVLFQASSNLALLLVWAFLSLKECIILPNAHTQQQQKSSPEPQAVQLQMSIGRQMSIGGQMSIGQQLASSVSNRPKRRGQLFMDAIQGMIKPVEVCGSFRSGSGASGREENRGRYGGNDGGGGAGGGGDRGASGSGHGSGASGSGGGSEGGDRGSDRGGDRGASGSGHGSGASGSGGGGDRGASGSGHGSGASGSGGGNECGDRGSDGGGDRGASGSGHGSGASGSGGGSEGGDRGRDGGGAEPECGGTGTNKEQAFESSKIIKMSIMLTAQTTGTLIGFHSIPTPSSSSKVLLLVALMDQLIAYLCGVTGILLSSNKPEDSKAAKIFAGIGFVCSTLGYILTIAMYVTPYLPWYSVLIVVLLFGVFWLFYFWNTLKTGATEVWNYLKNCTQSIKNCIETLFESGS